MRVHKHVLSYCELFRRLFGGLHNDRIYFILSIYYIIESKIIFIKECCKMRMTVGKMINRSDIEKYLEFFGEKYKVKTSIEQPTMVELFKSYKLLRNVGLYPGMLSFSDLFGESEVDVVYIARAIAKMISDLADAIGYIDKMEGSCDVINESFLMANIDKVKRNEYGKLTNASKKDIATIIFKQNLSCLNTKNITKIFELGEKMKKEYIDNIDEIANILQDRFYNDKSSPREKDILFNEIVNMVEKNNHLYKLIFSNLKDKDHSIENVSSILGLQQITGNVILEPKKNLFHPLAYVMFNQNHPYIKKNNDNSCKKNTLKDHDKNSTEYSKEERTVVGGNFGERSIVHNIYKGSSIADKIQRMSSLFSIKIEGQLKNPIKMVVKDDGFLSVLTCTSIAHEIIKNGKTEMFDELYQKYEAERKRKIDMYVSMLHSGNTSFKNKLMQYKDLVEYLNKILDNTSRSTYENLIEFAKYLVDKIPAHPFNSGSKHVMVFVLGVDVQNNPLYPKLVEAFRVIGPANRMMFDKEIISRGLLIAKVPELNTTICEILARYTLENFKEEAANVILEDAEKISQYTREYIEHIMTMIVTINNTPIGDSEILPPELEKVTGQMNMEDRYYTIAKAIIIYGLEEKVTALYDKIKAIDNMAHGASENNIIHNRPYKATPDIEKEVIKTLVELINKNEIGVYINRNGLFLNVEDPGHINTIIKDLKRNINFYLDKPFSSIPFGSIIATLPRYVLVKNNGPYASLTKYKEAFKNLKS